jgi:hypothetical protein
MWQSVTACQNVQPQTRPAALDVVRLEVVVREHDDGSPGSVRHPWDLDAVPAPLELKMFFNDPGLSDAATVCEVAMQKELSGKHKNRRDSHGFLRPDAIEEVDVKLPNQPWTGERTVAKARAQTASLERAHVHLAVWLFS